MNQSTLNYIKVIIMLPIGILGLLLLMVVDLVRMVQGNRTMDEEWHYIYMDDNMNHGMRRK